MTAMERGHRSFPGPVVRAIAAGTVLFLVAPIAAIAIVSFSASRFLEFPPREYSLRWYANALTDESWRAALLLSFETAAIVALLATMIGGLAAYGFVRGRFRGKAVLLGIALSPLVVPGIVTAVGMYFVFAQFGLIETRTGLVLAHTALALPVALISVASSVSTLERPLEHAARSLGATPFETFRYVTLPLIRPGVAVAALFAFVTSFDEPVVALFIAGTHAETLPKRMWDGIQYEIDPTATAMSTMLVLLAAVVVFIVTWLRREAEGR